MARECVLCGETVRGFGTRGINKQLRRTLEMTDRLRAARQTVAERGPLVEGGDNGPLLQSLDCMIQEGESYADFWHNAVHDIDVPGPSEARVIKREWVAWGKGARPVLRLLDLPPETLVRVLSESQ